MKRLLYLATAVACLFTSCGKEDPATGVNIDEAFTSKATIKGVAYVNTNTSSNTIQQNVPEGTQLVFTIANSEYGVTGSGSYVKTANIGENGAFEVELPAREDGTPVTVNITGDPVLVEIDMDGVVKKQIFKIQASQSESIVKGLTYQKKITYQGGENLSESASWEEGTYTASLKYYNGKEDVNVPEGTEVKVSIAKDKFVPERTNDLVFIEKVQSGGRLEIKVPAKSLLDGGLPIKMESAFIAQYIDVTAGNEIASKNIFELTKNDNVYGGEVNNAGTIKYTKGSKIEEGKADWLNATYSVKIRYAKDLSDPSALSNIPDNAKITIKTTNRSILDTSLSEITTIKSGSAANPLEVTFSAPNPAVSNTPLSFQITVDFIADITNASGNKETRKFSQTVVTSSIWGGIDKKYNDGDNTVTVTGTIL